MRSLIKLASNPLELDEDDEDDAKENKMQTKVAKGRSVSGPRTKLAAEDRFNRLERSVVSLSQAVRSLAKGMYSADGEEPMDDYDEEEDPMDIPMEDEEDEDQLELDDDYFGSDFAPYDGEDEMRQRSAEDTEQDEPEDIPGVSHSGNLTKRARLNRARISKDDAASNFGEKDSDVPGNRPLDPDKKNKDAGEYLIQGSSSDGPGPISKGQAKAIAQIVRGELTRAGVIAKAEGPRVGANTKVDKSQAVDLDEMFDQYKKLSWKDLVKARVDFGDLPAGII